MFENYETPFEEIDRLKEEIEILKKALRMASESVSKENKYIGNLWSPEDVYKFFYTRSQSNSKY